METEVKNWVKERIPDNALFTVSETFRGEESKQCMIWAEKTKDVAGAVLGLGDTLKEAMVDFDKRQMQMGEGG